MSEGETWRLAKIEKMRKYGSVNKVVMDGLFAAGIEHDKIPLEQKGLLRLTLEGIAALPWKQQPSVIQEEASLLQDAGLVPESDWAIKIEKVWGYIERTLLGAIDVPEQQMVELKSLVRTILEDEKSIRGANR